MSGRPEQPKCPECKRAVYKRMDAGPVKTSDPYAWCRNQKCDMYNTDQSGGKTRFPALGGKAPEKPAKKAEAEKPPKFAKPAKEREAAEDEKPAKPLKTARPTVKLGKKPEKAAKSDEEKAAIMESARERIKKAIGAVEQSYSKAIIGLALAIVSQEIGQHDAADSLIREFKLEKKYGLKPKGSAEAG